MPLNIKIENFEGPFDLLLHLIKKNKMDIYHVQIYEITNQYMEYIHRINRMDLEITSEFILMASTLLEIKSRMLLPKHEPEDEGNNEDPRKELVGKLIEYKKFKAVAEFLRKRENKVGRSFGKKPEIVEKKGDATFEDLLNGITMLKLYNIYYNLMDTYMKKMNTENTFQRRISVDRFKVEDKMKYIMQSIQKGKILRFSNIIAECSYKIEKVVAFVALLELMRLGRISAVQKENFKEIYMEGLF